jgi:hypothetical protein
MINVFPIVSNTSEGRIIWHCSGGSMVNIWHCENIQWPNGKYMALQKWNNKMVAHWEVYGTATFKNIQFGRNFQENTYFSAK